ncbi:cAMP-binding domain of CRP or a regulatory subunit of cAMP-dependent protein kinases [Microbulbifer donghaiensis]|uniref:cAMP-binding domain of CRP or a regulatory subunit of cAMP-dependent protein kinases n=1 Tax=Microbulbifer donghaiensis TaxID=494016 RepID=A0A1M5E0K5_9GAMM|nr:Crp/Fnr family transcriptional regulator [Microbulbifer donghaiensis]SHF72644.1 cAMP-binding domain of CRP or a regulatory subunit of cAMP-dependent protein kinases [Microbulbifer donghaiensis]
MRAIDYAGILKHQPIFSQFTDAECEELSAYCTPRNLVKNEHLFQQGEAATGFYIVVHGRIKLALQAPRGAEKVVEIVTDGGSFGEAAMFIGKPYPVLAQALCESLVIFVRREFVVARIASDPQFARNMLCLLSHQLHGLIADVESYSLKSATERIAAFVLKESARRSSDQIVLALSKCVLASRLSITPETLSRTLHQMSSRGLVEVDGPRIRILDRPQLHDMLQPG